MAGNWIKFEVDTPEKPEVLALTVAMGWDDPDLTVGKLLRVWRWFDQHTLEGNAPGVSAALLDRIAGVTGFSTEMAKVGWLIVSDEGISLPNFDRHNGETAKSRALTAKRVAKHKANSKCNDAGNAASVTSPLPKEEKNREENLSQALPKNIGGSAAASPAPRSPSKASRLPLDWVLPKPLGDWALQERPDWTAEHVRKVAEQFRDHWHAQGGANARKVDWSAAWRTWVRREPAGRVAGAGASAAPDAGWHETPEGVSAKGAELGVHQREGENRFVYRWRVLKAAGDAALIEKEVSAAARMNIAEHERAHQYFYGCLPGQMAKAAA